MVGDEAQADVRPCGNPRKQGASQAKENRILTNSSATLSVATAKDRLGSCKCASFLPCQRHSRQLAPAYARSRAHQPPWPRRQPSARTGRVAFGYKSAACAHHTRFRRPRPSAGIHKVRHKIPRANFSLPRCETRCSSSTAMTVKWRRRWSNGRLWQRSLVSAPSVQGGGALNEQHRCPAVGRCDM